MAETLNQRWSSAIVGELSARGVRHAVICPGSRSTPLALAFADAIDIKIWSIIDERSAAFFALGLSKGSGQPAAIVCTSGTAGAHFLPAVIEAAEGATPLVVLTADRPWELHGYGAPQTIDQRNLFGGFVRAHEALPAPEDGAPMESHLRTVVARAVSTAISERGPVHLNVPFREPLAPPSNSSNLQGGTRATRFFARRAAPAVEALAEVERALKGVERGLIVCGPRERHDGFGDAVTRLGRSLGFPVLAEASSNARYGQIGTIGYYDAILRCPAFADAHKPQVVLRFGGGLTPKAPQQWLDGSRARVFSFNDTGHVFDPGHSAEAVIDGDAIQVCDALVASAGVGRPTAYRDAFRKADSIARENLTGIDKTLSEPAVARAVVAALPDGANLVLSSSMPIRDVDGFAGESRGPLQVYSNRGANGIDGVVSTALGIAAGSGRPTALLIGDLALLHDASGLIAARSLGIPLTVCVVNNDGGGIFSFLPIAEQGAGGHFEKLFGTPHGIDMGELAALARAKHSKPESVTSLREHVARVGESLQVIEVKTDRQENVRLHRQWLGRVGAAIGELKWR